MSGAKDPRSRAEIIRKRRSAAAAQVADFNSEFENLKLALELEKEDYNPQDYASLQAALTRIGLILDSLFRDISEISAKQVPEKVLDQQAFDLIQPALRIETRSNDFRHLVSEAKKQKVKLDLPRQSAAGNLDQAQQKRFLLENSLKQTQQIVEELERARAETYPEIFAAFSTAKREFLAGSQLLDGSKQALLRKSYGEGEDLAKRAWRILESCNLKLDLVQQAGKTFANAPHQAAEALDESLHELTRLRSFLAARAGLLNQEPNALLLPAVTKIGEARRAIKALSPDYEVCIRLAGEAASLLKTLEETISGEAERLGNAREGAANALRQMEEAVQLARLTLNNQKQVPVKATQLYQEARSIRESLLAVSYTHLTLPTT